MLKWQKLWVVVALVLEAVGLVAGGIQLWPNAADLAVGSQVVLSAEETLTNRQAAMTLAFCAWVCAVLLLWGARALVQDKRAAQAPILTWQLLQFSIGIWLLGTETVIAVILMLLAVPTAAILLLQVGKSRATT